MSRSGSTDPRPRFPLLPDPQAAHSFPHFGLLFRIGSLLQFLFNFCQLVALPSTLHPEHELIEWSPDGSTWSSCPNTSRPSGSWLLLAGSKSSGSLPVLLSTHLVDGLCQSSHPSHMHFLFKLFILKL